MTATADAGADHRLMGLALALGRRNLGATSPNPSVGAVVVDGAGRILAQGVTAPGGRPHAEPLALASAGELARGATLYVSLEPCSHHGRSPPCADAIVRAGIARVVSAMPDPNPRVAGGGHAVLEAAGVAVVTGVRAAEAARDHRGHLTVVRMGRPAVTLKLARTADGAAGVLAGPRLMISGPEANARTHMIRAQSDAILVGVSTVRADDPRLDVRLPGLEDRSPVRIVLDSLAGTPPASRLVRTARARPTLILCTPAAPASDRGRLEAAGCETLPVAADPSGRVDLAAAAAALAGRGLTRMLCEGGPALADALAAADLLDEAVLLTSPDPLGRPGLPAVGPNLAARLAGTLTVVRSEPVGRDLFTFHERSDPCSPAS